MENIMFNMFKFLAESIDNLSLSLISWFMTLVGHLLEINSLSSLVCSLQLPPYMTKIVTLYLSLGRDTGTQ